MSSFQGTFNPEGLSFLVDSGAQNYTSSYGGSSGAPSPGNLKTCQNFAFGLNQISDGSPLSAQSSYSAPALGQSPPSRAQSLPLQHAPVSNNVRGNVSAPQPDIHTINLTPHASSPSYANVILNFNYGLGEAQWGQAKRLPGQQFGTADHSLDITPSFKLHPDLHSTPIHPIDPNKTPSSLFDTMPSSYFQVSGPVKHLFDSRLLKTQPSGSHSGAQTSSISQQDPSNNSSFINANIANFEAVPVSDETYLIPKRKDPSDTTVPTNLSIKAPHKMSGSAPYTGCPYGSPAPSDVYFKSLNKELSFNTSSMSGGSKTPLDLSVSTANSVLGIIAAMAQQEKNMAMQGLKNFQKKRRDKLCNIL